MDSVPTTRLDDSLLENHHPFRQCRVYLDFTDGLPASSSPITKNWRHSAFGSAFWRPGHKYSLQTPVCQNEVIDGLVLLVDKQSDYSFPSGHSCAAFAAATVCWKMLPRPYGGSILLLAALMAFSRLYVGVHYPSDVLGGILIGTAAGFAAMKLIHGISCKKTLEKG